MLTYFPSFFIKKQPYMEQAARDKTRAEQEKSEYEVRTINCCYHLSERR